METEICLTYEPSKRFFPVDERWHVNFFLCWCHGPGTHGLQVPCLSFCPAVKVKSSIRSAQSFSLKPCGHSTPRREWKFLGNGENSPVGTLGNGGHEVKSSAFALKAAVSFSVSSLELAPVVSAQPLICPCWELRWSSLRSETPSPATTSCTSGRSPYMTCEVWVPRSSTASSVLGPSTTSVSKISSPVDAASTHFSRNNGGRF